VAGVVPGKGGFVFYEVVTVEDHFEDNAEKPADHRQGWTVLVAQGKCLPIFYPSLLSNVVCVFGSS
jgi:hypothetical protein